MHIPAFFKIEDNLIIDSFIRQHSFASLISRGIHFPIVSHIPIELETNAAGEQVLWGHLSKANPQWLDFAVHPQVLAVFMSPFHHYISSSWYGHENVPTWNYISVQVSGTIHILPEEESEEALRRLMTKYEAGMEKPMQYDQLSEQTKKQKLGIVGFEIKINTKEAAFKLSQNRNRNDFQQIILQLETSSDPIAQGMASEMRRFVTNL
jgi:transcriptional regulator